jgi:tetratricopeptide (TPR) repeat protein
MRIGDLSKGEQRIEAALRLDPHLPLAHIAQGHLLYSQASQMEGDRQQRVLDNALLAYEKAASMLEGQNDTANGQDVLALNDLGAILLQRQKLDAAETRLRKAVELARATQAQRGGPGEDIFLAAAHLNLGVVHMYRGYNFSTAKDAMRAKASYEAALEQYRAAIAAYPRNAGFYAELATALLNLDRRPEAEEAAREAAARGLREHQIFDEIKVLPNPRKASRGVRTSRRKN